MTGKRTGEQADRVDFAAKVRLIDEMRRFETRVVDTWVENLILRDIRLVVPTDDKPEWFVVVRAWVENYPMVSFTSAATMEAAIDLTMARLMNGSVKWKADEYAK